ncbi:MAG: enoyl-ACP reductase FabV [Francisellaceae bacterium]
MIIKPEILRGCLMKNPHPLGCKAAIAEQIAYVQSRPGFNGAKKALIIGGSSGYGLASRIALAFGSDCDTICVSFENGLSAKRLGTAGWWNNIWFSETAREKGLIAKNFIGDAFSHELKQQVIDYIQNQFGGKIDVLIYSLASGQRNDPETGINHKSVLKSTVGDIKAPTLDLGNQSMVETTMGQANEEDIANTIKVMGGEDWQMWVDKLYDAGVLVDGFKTTAYSYDGSRPTIDIYKKGTIGAAKRHLEETSHALNDHLQSINGESFITVAKALVTKASAYIPIFPLYGCALFKVMKEDGCHESCIEQIYRFMADMMYGEYRVIDDEGRVRPDNLEMQPHIQQQVEHIMAQLTSENFKAITDFAGFYHDFLALNGFDIEGVDYDADVDIDALSKLTP